MKQMHRSRGKLFIISLFFCTLGSILLFTQCRKNCCNQITVVVVPEVTTDSVTGITHNSAQGGGVVTSDGGAAVTARGVCWSTAPSPTLADSLTADSSGTGPFTSLIANLLPDTTYYVRAYAINSAGTGYGAELSFQTLMPPTLPTVTTNWASHTTQITSTSGGDVTSDGGDTVTARGVCWSTVSGPTLSDPHTVDGSDTGSFTSQITNLQPNTQYYIRAYATNSQGTAYGNEVGALTTPDASPCLAIPTLMYEGQLYHTVMIGSQCWIRENLNVGSQIPGGVEQTDNDIKEKYCYDDLPSNCDVYGGLYQWGEIVQYLNGASNTTTWDPAPSGPVQGLCPPGWHLPSKEEADILTNYLGGESVAGGKMKETGSTHWNAPNTGATNQSGFTVLPAGSRINATSFIGLGIDTRLCVVSGNWPTGDFVLYLHYLNERAESGTDNKTAGNSIRCIQDNELPSR